MTVDQQLGELKAKIKQLSNSLANTSQKIEKLWTQKQLDLEQIRVKESELEQWRQKLEPLQQERIRIKQDLKNQANQHIQELEELDNLLEQERSQYRSIRDKLISRLIQDCPLCLEKERAINYLTTKSSKLLTVIWMMIVLFFIFHIWFIWLAWSKKKKKNN